MINLSTLCTRSTAVLAASPALACSGFNASFGGFITLLLSAIAVAFTGPVAWGFGLFALVYGGVGWGITSFLC